MTDLGPIMRLDRVPAKLKEHYGIDDAGKHDSTDHRTACRRDLRPRGRAGDRPGTAAGVIFIGELDGSMVPVVEPSPECLLRRHRKGVFELERSAPESRPSAKAVSPRCSGEHLPCVGWRKRAAMGALCGESEFGPGSQLHAVGDGAPLDCEPGGSALWDPVTWSISSMCEYLGAAASGLCDHPQAWLDVQKERLKADRAPAVLDAFGRSSGPMTTTTGDRL